MTYLEQLLGRYLSVRARSEQEIRRYLEQKRKKIAVSDQFIDDLIAKYTRLGYINDAQFAESLAHSVLANKAKGTQFLRMKLKLAGVDSETTQATLAQIDAETITAGMEKRLARYQQKWAELPLKERRMKAYSKLLTSGFSSSEIRPFLDEWLQKR